MSKHPTSTLALFVALAILFAAPALAQGEIVITQAKANAGNVTPGDAPGFPVRLSQPGSYILASNLQPPAGKAGINIASHDVTIDMNGFRLRGASVATTGIYGGSFGRVRIRNGTITGCDAHGIYGTGDNWIVEDMLVVQNGEYGIFNGDGDYFSVRRSTVTQNGNTGILCSGTSCLVENSIASGNVGIGIQIGIGTVLGSVITGNGGFGISGSGVTGYGNNTVAANNGGGANPQVEDAKQMHPNLCSPACP
jgi:hypothetical protein